jgi:hypothetical protein
LTGAASGKDAVVQVNRWQRTSSIN